MWKKILPIGLVLVMVLSFVTCVGEPSAQEIVDAVIEAQDDIRTCEFEVDMTLGMSGEVEGEAVEMNITMKFSGALDPDNREMRINLSTDTDMEMPREPDEEELIMVTYLAGDVTVAVYLVGDMRYAMMGTAGEEPMWTKYEASERDWEEMSEGIALILQTETQIGLLETTQVKVIGSEKVKDVDCYVLQLTPDMEQLWQLAAQHPLLTDMGMFTAVGEDILQDMFRSFSVKQWVTKDTHFLTRAEVDMALDLTPEALGVEEGQMTMDVTISMLAYNHNQPVTIVLPPEAEEAVEVPTFESSTEGELEAAETELANVQAATIALMVDNELSELPNLVTVATNDMSAFPDTSVCGVDKINDWDGNAYQSGDKDGYILYQHDIDADNTQNNLVNYIVSQYTMGTYTVDTNGTVTQVTTGYE